MSERGHKYAEKLFEYIQDEVSSMHLQVWTSTMKRTIQTGHLFADDIKTQWKCLEEINAGKLGVI